MPPRLPSAIKKRSVSIKGFKTSMSLEEPFWLELKRIASERNVRVSDLIAAIDRDRKYDNLSCCLRLAVIADMRAKLDAAAAPMLQAAE